MSTIYSASFHNHNIKIENSFAKCSLLIDGKEKDTIKGFVARDNANILRASFTDGEKEYTVEVLIDIVTINRGIILHPTGHRFSIKINDENVASGFISGRQQKKYGMLNEDSFIKPKK